MPHRPGHRNRSRVADFQEEGGGLGLLDIIPGLGIAPGVPESEEIPQSSITGQPTRSAIASSGRIPFAEDPSFGSKFLFAASKGLLGENQRSVDQFNRQLAREAFLQDKQFDQRRRLAQVESDYQQQLEDIRQSNATELEKLRAQLNAEQNRNQQQLNVLQEFGVAGTPETQERFVEAQDPFVEQLATTGSEARTETNRLTAAERGTQADFLNTPEGQALIQAQERLRRGAFDPGQGFINFPQGQPVTTFPQETRAGVEIGPGGLPTNIQQTSRTPQTTVGGSIVDDQTGERLQIRPRTPLGSVFNQGPFSGMPEPRSQQPTQQPAPLHQGQGLLSPAIRDIQEGTREINQASAAARRAVSEFPGAIKQTASNLFSPIGQALTQDRSQLGPAIKNILTLGGTPPQAAPQQNTQLLEGITNQPFQNLSEEELLRELNRRQRRGF